MQPTDAGCLRLQAVEDQVVPVQRNNRNRAEEKPMRELEKEKFAKGNFPK
jgi:hypothetical protein